MNIHKFLRKRLTQLEALGLTIVVFAVIIFSMLFIVVSTSETVRDAMKALLRKVEKKKVKQKPVILAKKIPVNIPKAPPKLKKMQKLNKRMIVKKDIKSKFKPKSFKSKRKTKVDFKTASRTGKNIRDMMNRDYANKFGVAGAGKGLRAVIDKFVVVSYQGGDWDSEFHHITNYVDNTRGSLPNLIREIKRRTDIDVKNDTPVVVPADAKEIHDSPFVYFTGHMDFKLTEKEVENLRAYIINGGAIVANSSLPGRRSRFDIAFRREMKRIMPDYDLKPIKKDHDIYKAFQQFPGPPDGMNYWNEPLEVIDIDDRVAVIYNLNDYGEMMLPNLDETGTEIKWGRSAEEPTYHWEGRLLNSGGFHRRYYANIDDVENILDSYMININILAYLLTR